MGEHGSAGRSHKDAGRSAAAGARRYGGPGPRPGGVPDRFRALSLRPIERAGNLSGPAGRTGRLTWDFVVDGVSLWEVTGAQRRDLVGCLDQDPRRNDEALGTLLARTPWPDLDGWTPLYVCPECGDPATSAVCVRVTRTAAGYLWSGGTGGGSPVGPFLFAVEDNERTILAASWLNAGG